MPPGSGSAAQAKLAADAGRLAAVRSELAALRRELAGIRRSWSRRLVQKVTGPAQPIKRLLQRYLGDHLQRDEPPIQQDYSQHGEQPILLRYFSETTVPYQRYVVDIGAFDGYVGSNSYALILGGWDGLLVEPVPEVYDRLAKLHAHRPNVRTVRTAVSNFAIEAATMFRVTGPPNTPASEQWQYSQVSTLRQDVVRCHPTDLGWEYHQITVPVTTLDRLLREHAVPHDFGYLSIDCEGEDMNVLRSMDLRQHRPRLISVECEDSNRPVFADYLREYGYSYYANTSSNTFFQITPSRA